METGFNERGHRLTVQNENELLPGITRGVQQATRAWRRQIAWERACAALAPTFLLLALLATGLLIQVHNVTTLSNVLVCTVAGTGTPLDKKRAQFKEWKRLYKTTVGALHIWSWRTSPGTGALAMVLGVAIVCQMVFAVLAYTAFMSEPDIDEADRLDTFLQSTLSLQIIPSTLLNTVIFLGFTWTLALVSSRYKRLHLLVATLRLPTHHLDDLTILGEQNAAVTIFDVPITPEMTVHAWRLLLVQGVLIALSTAGAL